MRMEVHGNQFKVIDLHATLYTYDAAGPCRDISEARQAPELCTPVHCQNRIFGGHKLSHT